MKPSSVLPALGLHLINRKTGKLLGEKIHEQRSLPGALDDVDAAQAREKDHVVWDDDLPVPVGNQTRTYR